MNEMKELEEKQQEKELKTGWVKEHQAAVNALVKKFQQEMAQVMATSTSSTSSSATTTSASQQSKPQTLTDSILYHYQRTRPTELTILKRKCFIAFLNSLATALFGESTTVKTYGSIACGLDDESSDIDVGISMKKRPFAEDAVLLKRMLELITKSGSQYITCFGTLQARVPIITISDSFSGLHADLSLRSADDKLKLFQEYLSIDPRVTPYLKAIKYWAKKRDICTSIAGTINSFGYCCTGIAILQTLSPPVLPNLQLHSGAIQSSSQFQGFGEKNTLNVGELLIKYFEVMSKFDYANKRISVLHGGFMEKESARFPHSTYFCIEDPLEPGVNFSRHVNEETAPRIMKEFARASQLLQRNALFDDICNGV